MGRKPTGQPKGRPNSRLAQRKPNEIRELKAKILELLESPLDTGCWTLTDCARFLGIPAIDIYGWSRLDEEFKEQTKHAEDIVADILIKRLIEVPTDQQKMAYVVAHIFLIKGLRPKFKESYKIVEPMGQEAREILKEFLEAGKKDNEPSTPQVEKQDELNPFEEIIKRLESAETEREPD